MTIRVLELHHHAVRTGPTQAETDAARDFYCEVLGMSADAGRRVRSTIPGYWLDVGDAAQLHLIGTTGGGAELLAALPANATPAMRAGAGIDPSEPHVALGVADVVAARAELERRAIPYRVVERAQPERQQLFLRDPAGNVVELHQVGTCRCLARSRSASADGYLRTQGAVMFADMRGFTTLAERLSPDAVVPLLNEFFTVLTDITDAHGGTVYNMAGDGLMAGFGVPSTDGDPSAHAVVAAREMLAAFAGIARRWKRVLDVDTGLGIGINAGDVIAGNVGSQAHRSYTLIGDTVNVAARLSQRARAGEALFPRGVKRALDALNLLGTRMPVLELPTLQLRGRSTPVEIWCLPADERVDFRAADPQPA